MNYMKTNIIRIIIRNIICIILTFSAAYLAYASCGCGTVPKANQNGSPDRTIDTSGCGSSCSGMCYEVNGAPQIETCVAGDGGCKSAPYTGSVYPGTCDSNPPVGGYGSCGCGNVSAQSEPAPAGVNTAVTCTCNG